MKAMIGYFAIGAVVVIATVTLIIVLAGRSTLADRANERCAAHNGVSRIESEQTIVCRDGYAADGSR